MSSSNCTIITNTDKVKSFKELLNNKERKDVIALFKRKGCPACDHTVPYFENLCKKLTGKNLIVVVIESSTAGNLFDQYNISAIPTIIRFQGEDMKNKIIGSDFEKLSALFNQYDIKFLDD
jgi:thiol-disulfide isomerase/thioredoxin